MSKKIRAARIKAALDRELKSGDGHESLPGHLSDLFRAIMDAKESEPSFSGNLPPEPLLLEELDEEDED